MPLSKSKIKDTSKREKDFKYKKFKHDSEAPLCTHCQFKEREQSLKDLLNSRNDNDTTELFNDKGVSLGNKKIKEIKVLRGKYDDVIGWVRVWQ